MQTIFFVMPLLMHGACLYGLHQALVVIGRALNLIWVQSANIPRCTLCSFNILYYLCQLIII